MSTEKKDTPNWGGNALGTGGVGDLAPVSQDDELRTKRTSLRAGQAAPDPEYSPGGPEVKRTLTHEYRSSVDDASR